MKIEKLINLDLLTQFFNNLKTHLVNNLSNSISIEYSDLVALRDNGELIPGMQYRITDFVTTVNNASNGRFASASNPFDVIVTAISNNTLNEDAKAALHEDDTYFANCDIDKWELKYCLDNNPNRFDWANPNEGKGVIYCMKDELGNECPYDFKNIMMYDKEATTMVHTFVAKPGRDASVMFIGTEYEPQNNVIRAWQPTGNIQSLNYIIFRGWPCSDNYIDENCNNMFFNNYCNKNIIGTNCSGISFGYNCSDNELGNNCSNISFESGCVHNTLGSDCSNNTLGKGCTNNKVGYNCYGNTLGNDCALNILGNNCAKNTIGSNSSYNTFGDNCVGNRFGDYCSNNELGNVCTSIIMEYGCLNNIFENNCYGIVFNSLSSSEFRGSYYRFNKFGQGCNNISLDSVDIIRPGGVTPDMLKPTWWVQNYNFINDIYNGSIVSITAERGLMYETKFARDTEDVVRMYTDFDTAETRVELVDNTNIENPDYDTMYLVCDRDYSQEYLTFEALEDNFTFIFKNNIEYKIEGDDTWYSLPRGTSLPTLNAGQRILLKGNCKVSGRAGIGQFSSKQKFNAMGNVMSLLFGDDFKDKYDLTGYNFAFYTLFAGTLILNAKNLILPVTTLADYCYSFMFQGCTSLTTAPELPATELANYCYSNMFYQCSSLTTAPELPATTLASNCYYYMFYGCTNLNYIKALFLTEPSRTYTSSWVHGVSSTGTFVKNNNAAWDAIGTDGIPEGWNVIEYPCISPAIVNSNDDITFYYNDGLYTPKKNPISLLSIFDYSQMMQLKPECDIEVRILSEGSLVESSYEWKCDMSLNDVIDDLNLYYEDITIVINKVIIESNDAGYYGYYYY